MTGRRSQFYVTGEDGWPRMLEEYAGPRGRIRPGDTVVYENPAMQRPDGSYATAGLDGLLTVTEIAGFGGGHPPQAVLNAGEYECDAGNLRRIDTPG